MFDTSSGNPLLPSLMTGEELAALMRYDGVTSAFRIFLKKIGVRPVPGRNDIYDPHHVRYRLDLAQGILRSAFSAPTGTTGDDKPLTKIEERRIRRGE